VTGFPKRPLAVLGGLGYLLLALPSCLAGQALPSLPAVPAAGMPCSLDDAENRVGEIEVDARNIFDLSRPGENLLLFRLANRLHRTTRPWVILEQLVFRSGDPFSHQALAESERVLRGNHYVYDAHVVPLRCVDHRVDVSVLTRDVWTLEGGVSFHRAGGANSSSFELQDINFLGSGKRIQLSQTSTVDRLSRLIGYRDPNLLGSRGQLDLSFSDNSDGKTESVSLERPFYSLDARWAAGVKGFMDRRVDSLYDAGHVVDLFRHQQDFLELYGGLSPGLVNGDTQRFRAGFTLDRNLFTRVPGSSFVPADRVLAYPWIGYQWIENGFTTERDLNRIQRTEDFNFGRQVDLKLGFSGKGFGGDRDRLIAAGTASAGWRPAPAELLFGSLFATARYAEGRAENAVVSGALRFYARDWGTSVTYVNLEGALVHRLDADGQLLLGGDSGLRGYPLRFEQGDRRVLLNLEQRVYGTREFFHLLYFGGAVFFDAGRAWFAEAHSPRGEGLLTDAGLGLRIGSSRSARGSVVHLDLAFPLNAGPTIKRAQWLVSTSESF
jgi:hypothetical protein